MRTEHSRRRQGFTLVELMIVVAIIGVLASVAIPSFRHYQWKAKRSEAYTNLGALAKTQRTYFSVADVFYGVALAEPGNSLPAPDNAPSPRQRPSAAVNTAFGPVGWSPEGAVYYDYDSAVDQVATCSCNGCFTLTAYGNVDGDANQGAVMYVHQGPDASECVSILFGMGAPLDAVTGAPIYDAPAPNTSQDDF